MPDMQTNTRAYDPRKQPKRVINDLENQLSVAVYGSGSVLNRENDSISKIISQTTSDVINKFGKRASENDLVNLFSTDAINSLVSAGNNNTPGADSYRAILEKNIRSANDLLAAESDRIIQYSNYEAMVSHIPECSMGLEVYVSNILSPDDYSKTIFDVKYLDTSNNNTDEVNQNLQNIMKKYKIEELTEKILREVLTYGDAYIAVLPYNREIAKMLTGLSNNTLNESSAEYSNIMEEYFPNDIKNTTEITLNESLDREILTESDNSVLEEFFDSYGLISENEKTRQSEIYENFNKILNENIKVHSVTDILKDRAEADNDAGSLDNIMSAIGVDIDTSEKKLRDTDGRLRKNRQVKLLSNLSGAAIRKLECDKIVEVSADNICYGYYYVEKGLQASGTELPVSISQNRMNAANSNPLNPSITPNTLMNPGDNSISPVARQMNISDEKLHLIANIILKGLSKKLNKKFIEDNKQFKELIYSLLKQEYLIKKGVKITFFMPDEVVHFHTKSLFQDSQYFGKLYLATLTNIILIKLSRGRDTRIVTVEMGLDSNYEQSIQKAIESLKTDEFQMGDLENGSIQDILKLAPGRFQDIFIPRINGSMQPIDFSTLPGMDASVRDEFLDYLKSSILNSMSLPASLDDAAQNIEFAKQVAAQNTFFLRRIIILQKQLTEPANILLRTIYKYEYNVNYDTTDNSSLTRVDVDKISVIFPSPGSLKRSALIEQLTITDQFASSIAQTYYPPTQTGIYDDKMNRLKGKIMKDSLPQLDWSVYDKLMEETEKETNAEDLKRAAQQSAQQLSNPPENDYDNYGNSEVDPSGNYGGGY